MRFNKKQRILAICLLVINVSAVHALELGLFGDASFQGSTQKNDDGQFAVGGLTLHGSQKIGEKTDAFVEYTLETGDTLVSRIWIKHTFMPMLQIGAGKFTSSLGYWNQNFNHGKLLQDTVTRPFFVDLDHAVAIFPGHLTGVKAAGLFNIDNGMRGSISYDFTLANGESIDSINPGEVHAVVAQANTVPTDKKMVVLRTTYQHPTLPMQISLNGMSNPIVESSEEGTIKGQKLISQSVVGLDFKITMGKFDVMAEYYNIRNKDKKIFPGNNSANAYTASAYYTQLSYGVTDKLKYVYRYANLEFKEGDSFFKFHELKQENRHTLALRYEMNVTNTLIFEAQKRDDATYYYLQWAFMML